MPKTALPPWMFSEFTPVGVDLDSPESVRAYDENQGTDPDADDALLDRLGVTDGCVLVDLGTGTGSLPVRAALRGAEVHAVDVSENMLAHARARAVAEGVEVGFHHGGFLSYRHQGPSAQVVTTRSALHQLPDTWKQVALCRMADMVAPGGVLYLWDAMWSFDADDTMTMLPAWIDAITATPGVGFTRDAFETHVREEFSTFAWVLESMIERAGLNLVESTFPAPWYGELIASRPD